MNLRPHPIIGVRVWTKIAMRSPLVGGQHIWTDEMLIKFSVFTFNSTCFFYGVRQKLQSGLSCWVSWRKLGRDICIDKSETLSILYWWTEEADKWPISVNFNWSMFKKKDELSLETVKKIQKLWYCYNSQCVETFDHWQFNCDLTMHYVSIPIEKLY